MKNKMIIISLIFLIITFISCEIKNKGIKKEKIVELPKHLINNIDVNELEIIKIDSCEYLFYKKMPASNMGFGFMSHKGNCKNPIHYYSRHKPRIAKK